MQSRWMLCKQNSSFVGNILLPESGLQKFLLITPPILQLLSHEQPRICVFLIDGLLPRVFSTWDLDCFKLANCQIFFLKSLFLKEIELLSLLVSLSMNTFSSFWAGSGFAQSLAWIMDSYQVFPIIGLFKI